MSSLKGNAPRFLDCLFTGLQKLGEHENVPDEDLLNEILANNDEPFRIVPPDLVYLEGDAVLVDEIDLDSETTYSDRYARVGEIGRGGFGIVYHVKRKTSLSEFDFAMKVLSPSPFSNKEKAERRFRREIESLKKLQHRSIVPIIESGLLPDGAPYYVMPLIVGRDFRDATEGVSMAKRLRILIEILDGVEFAHSVDVLHRDLKPRNIMVRESDEQPLILDFGAAFLLDDFEGETLTTENIGTLGYIPLEVQNDPKRRTKGHDVYACGILLYEAFARVLPNPQDYEPLSGIDPGWSVLDDIVQSAIAPASQRLSSASELKSRILYALNASGNE